MAASSGGHEGWRRRSAGYTFSALILYFAATGVSLMNDRRRARREAEEPDDDEASDLDLTPEDIGEIESVTAGPSLPAQADSDRDRDPVNGYDDVT